MVDTVGQIACLSRRNARMLLRDAHFTKGRDGILSFEVFAWSIGKIVLVSYSLSHAFARDEQNCNCILTFRLAGYSPTTQCPVAPLNGTILYYYKAFYCYYMPVPCFPRLGLKNVVPTTGKESRRNPNKPISSLRRTNLLLEVL
jgi:hypothetical protein